MNWLGAMLVVCASYVCGITLAKDEGNSLKTLDSLLNLLSYMRRRMSLERMPLFDIFSDFNDEYLEKIGFLKIIRSHRNGLTALWSDAISTLSIDEETKREYLRFGESLGSLPFDEQIVRLDSLSVFITEKRNELRISLPDKQKSIKTVSLLLGLMTAIILL